MSTTPESPESGTPAPPSEPSSWSASPDQGADSGPQVSPRRPSGPPPPIAPPPIAPPPIAPPPVHTEPGLHLARHLAGGLIGLVLTPVGIGLLLYGGYRYEQRVFTAVDIDHDARGLAAFAAGGFVLLIVACMGALSPGAPLLSGFVWGLAPAAAFLAVPADMIRWVLDAPLIPDEIEGTTLSWMALGCFLGVGVALVGTGFTAALRRG